ncbi:MAG TPA: hypothetical protein VGC41_19050 [Kofleriaceae bacterium]
MAPAWVTIQTAPTARTSVLQRGEVTVLALVDASELGAAEGILERIAATIPTSEYHWTQLLIDLDLELYSDKVRSSAIILEVEGSTISGASIGDSGAWWIDEFGVENLTERQIERSVLGDGNAHPYAFRIRGLEKGRLLVATRSLLAVDKATVVSAVRGSDLTAASKALAQLAEATFVLCQS